MSLLSPLRSFVHRVFHRGEVDDDLAAELRSQLDLMTDQKIKDGMKPDEARRAAKIELGGVEQVKEQVRAVRTGVWLDSFWQDLRFAMRSLRRNRGFASTTILILSLAIGANVAIFSALDAVLLRPLPFPSPDRLTMLWTHVPKRNKEQLRTAYWNVEQWAEQSKSFEEIAVFDPSSATLTGTQSAEKIKVVRASASLARVLGVQPFQGRWFSEDEAVRRLDVALVSYSFWRAHFDSGDALGSELVIDGIPTRIIGILPEDFRFPEGDVWEPETTLPDWPSRRAARGSGSWFVVGRLRPNVSVTQAQTEMSIIAKRIDPMLPTSQTDEGVTVMPLRDYLVGPDSRLTLWSLTGALLCILLIACSNVAGLSLARSTVRRKEFALRAALGASHTRIIRQVLIESFALSGISGVLGLFVALAGTKLLAGIVPAEIAHLQKLTLNFGALGCAIGLCVVTGVFVGLASSMPTVKRGFPLASLSAGGRGMTPGEHSSRSRRILLVSEFALTTVLLIGAGLLVRTLHALEGVRLGFQPDRVLSVQLSTRDVDGATRREDFYSRLLARVGSLPGVQSAAIVEDFFTNSISGQLVSTEGSNGLLQQAVQFRLDAISPAFFETVGARLLKGRLFSAEDTAGSNVAIINERMARVLWSTDDAIGQEISFSADTLHPNWFTVIGIVEDMRREGPENEATPQAFEPLNQDPPGLATLLVRTSGDDLLHLMPSIKSGVADINKYVPVYQPSPLESQLGDFSEERRVQASLVTCFSVLGLLMAAIGLYGVVQYDVSMRTQEIGIRMTVGAQRGEVLRMILLQGMKIPALGLVIGIAASWVATRLIAKLLYSIAPDDPITFATVFGILVGMALLACWIPARRAMRMDPMVALRHE